MKGERAGTPGANWETGLASTGECWVPDGAPEPAANRAARRAAKRGRGRVGAQQAPGKPSAPLSRPNSPQRSGSRQNPENGSQGRDSAPPTRTETHMPDPAPLAQLLIIVDRAERGVILPAEAARLRAELQALHQRANQRREAA